ncbi:insulin receptor substrate 2-like [Periophthalmus magnuspinnatus]|uniref:insulin receptor substrate 2-like n=1 Tax=Periophthalmus magnuspinnatus TaxID=409849 RepID=UPI00145A6B4A|nr:insulin receptor substrate 2-like [Periophthalmus magnuspinnatus]
MASPPPTPTATGGHLLSNGGVKKCGYLRKQKHGHRRFFVLQEATDRVPARLEYYESEKKWRNKSAAKRCITLDSCLCVNKRADAKHKHLVALYTKDEYFAVAADNEQEQDSWYRVLSELIAEGKVSHSPASTSSLVGFEESSYGPAAPVSAPYREVWQVNLKAKGLGQVKNLVGVYRLCLSSRTISFVKLNSEAPAVSLQLMNIRRCGHSDHFFFIEVGRSAVTGSGEFWMQAEDSVVAQNIHETILEAMKAMRELSEFRPRSKSQSASTNPISVPTRRNLNNLPPSQTGLVRRSRTDSTAAMSPGRKFTSCRVRTSSEGDGSVTRPISMSIPISGSPTSLGNHVIHAHMLSSGRTCRMLESNHSRSMSGSSSPPAVSSPLSASPRAPTAVSSALSTPDKTRRPFSCSGSICGSLSDNTFILCDDLSSSPSEARFMPLMRSDTPESVCSTPPSRDASEPCAYMIMEGSKSAGSSDKAYRKRTHSLTTPRQQRVVAPLSSASLDEYTLMRMGENSQSASPKVSYPEDYCDIEIGSLHSSNGNLVDDGYMPMTPGVAQQSQTPKVDSYVLMSPMCVSAPKQIVNPRVHPQVASGGNYKTNSPCGSSLEDSGYMRMYCGSKSSMDSPDRHGEYMNMSPGNPPPLQTPPDYFMNENMRPMPYQTNSLTLPARLPTSTNEDNQYVLMSPQNYRQRSSDSDYYSVMQPSQNSSLTFSPIRNARPDSTPYRGRVGRPNRLSLDAVRTLPSMNEHPNNEPRSPGEYINIEFNPAHFSPPSTVSTESQASSLGSNSGGPSDYMNLDLSAKEEAEEREEFENLTQERGHEPKSDYQEMSFGMTSSPPQMVPQNSASGRLPLSPLLSAPHKEHQVRVFHLDPSPDLDRSAKVIRANPTGRRRHSSETFSSTATITPVFPSFAQKTPQKRHSSVENLSSRSSDGSDEEASSGSPTGQSGAARAGRAEYAASLNYLALLEGKQEEMVGFKAAQSCKGVVNGLHASPYVCLGFKEAATTAKD